MHSKSWQHSGLIRHLILALIVTRLVSKHIERWQGKRSTGDAGASVSGVECAVCDGVSSSPGCECDVSGRVGDSVSSAT